ncbi:hypothetical protein HanRHA438_Chr12g0573421 [Helianthus annuus]|nr:hypothetical protein HanRHA438_Chr12g0573421 [Helianthus annuus]
MQNCPPPPDSVANGGKLRQIRVRFIIRPPTEVGKYINVMGLTIEHSPFAHYWRVIIGNHRSKTVIHSPWRLLTTLWTVNFLINRPSIIPSITSPITSSVATLVTPLITPSHKTRNPVRVSIVVVKPIVLFPLIVVSWLAVIFATVISPIPVPIVIIPHKIGVLVAKLVIFKPSCIVDVTLIHIPPIFVIINPIMVISPIVRIFRMNTHMFR